MKLLNLNNVLRDQPLEEISESGHYMMTESSVSNHHHLISLSSHNFCCNKCVSETHSYRSQRNIKVKKSRVKSPPSDRDDPEKSFTILLDLYGCSQSFVSLQKQFFQRRQQEGESLREYSHALMALMEGMKCKNLQGICNPDFTLRDQFIEHMHDSNLRR